MITFTAISLPPEIAARSRCRPPGAASANRSRLRYVLGMELANFDSLRRVAIAVVIEPPRGHLTRQTPLHRYDDVAVPRPGVLAVKFAGFCRMVRVRMVPADHLEILFPCRRFRGSHVFCRHGKAVP